MPRPADSPTAAPWALLWLGGIAAGVWLPLLLIDHLSPPLLSGSRLRPTIQPVAPAKAQGKGSLPGAMVDFGPLALAGAVGGKPGTGPTPASLLLGSRDETPRLLSAIAAEPGQADRAISFSDETAPASGSLLLGGTLGLESLSEKAMVPAARTEQARRASAADRLQALPLHWRADMLVLLKGGPEHVLPAEVVHLPAPHLSQPEEIPLAVKRGGLADTTVQPSSIQSKQALERWAERQAPIPRGSVRPVVVVLEPIAAAADSADVSAAVSARAAIPVAASPEPKETLIPVEALILISP
jgi:hypothetical protein